MNGTQNKSVLGANTPLLYPLQAAHAAAADRNMPLYAHVGELYKQPDQYSMPLPMMNILKGGEHADNNMEIQEFMIQPVSASSFREGLRMGAEVFHSLKKVLQQRGPNTAGGVEGGFAPDLNSNEEALIVIYEPLNLQATSLAPTLP